MKKTLVLLLILAVAGGIFAQDGFGGKGEIRMGADIDFYGDDDDSDASIKPSEDHSYGQWALTFDKEAFHSELIFKGDYTDLTDASMAGTPGYVPTGDQVADAAATYKPASGGSKIGFMGEYGDSINGTEGNFKVHAEVALNKAIAEDRTFLTSLYAYHYFLDRQLKVDWAFKGYETIYWRVSDLVASDWDNLDGNGGVEVSFMPTAVAGLNVGLFFPGHKKGGAFPEGDGGWLMADFFKRTVIGGKYETGPLSASAMFKMGPNKTEAFNFGVKYKLNDTMAARVDAQFENLGDFGDTGLLKAGANFEYTVSPITAGATLKIAGMPVDYMGKAKDEGGMAIGEDFYVDTIPTFFYINPYFYYDIIPDTLQARLPVTVAIGMSEIAKDCTILLIEPKLYWNMAQDGVTDDPAYGMLFEYSYGHDLGEASETVKSTLAVKFRFTF